MSIFLINNNCFNVFVANSQQEQPRLAGYSGFGSLLFHFDDDGKAEKRTNPGNYEESGAKVHSSLFILIPGVKKMKMKLL